MPKSIEDVLEGLATRIVFSSPKELIVECLKTNASAVVEACYPEQWDWYRTHVNPIEDADHCFVSFKATPVHLLRA
jgi:hypothetical protein